MIRFSLVILAAALLCGVPFPAAHAAPAPGGPWDGADPQPVVKKPEPLWSLRTGFRKGITDQAQDAEIFSGPDGAILKHGLFTEWTGLLAEFRESFALVAPDDVAGLAGTKPYLIIPSGGLSGLSASAFFRAGLAEYARSGGIILCFTQQNSGDLDALPVPDGAKLEAAGWEQDAGPLFRSSLVQDRHPVLAGMRRAAPSIETDGYLRTVPDGSRVLLARSDGFPTLALYPYGSGWVVVTTLMSDRSFGTGLLDGEERSLVRDLLLWAKSGGAMAQLAPGATFQTSLLVSGPEQGEAVFVRMLVMGTQQERPLHDRTMPLILRSGQTGSLPFTYAVPADAPTGIYHVEYTLMDGGKRPLSPQAEGGNGWFAVLPQSPPPARTVRAPQAMTASAVRYTVLPSAVPAGDALKLDLDVSRASGPAGEHELFVRVGGQEKTFKMTRDRETFSVEVPKGRTTVPLSYALYHSTGRSIARGAVPAALPQKAGVSVDRAWYRPGQNVRISVQGMGLGAVTLTGLGSVLREHISKDRTFEIPVPQSLPAGTFPLLWEFETRAGVRQEGEVAVPVRGAQALCTGITVTVRPGGKDASVTASLRISSSDAIGVLASIQPVSPAGKTLPAVERSVQVTAGAQDVVLTAPFQPDEAGLWSLRYTLAAPLPEGPGYSAEPAVLSAGQAYFDVGDSAVLGMSTDKAVYQDAAGPGRATVLLYGNGAVKAELFLDGKRVRKETVEARGVTSLSLPFSDLAPGMRALKAVVAGNGPAASREIRFLYGARLPDLIASIKTGELAGPALEVGVGVMNQGKVASGHVEASLYEGDPDKGGTLIKKVPVPPLAPGKQHVFIVKWPLVRKAGPRTLFAVADRDGRAIESGRENNTTSFSLTVPNLLLSLMPDRTTFRADEPVRYKIRAVNFSPDTLKPLVLDLQTADPSGRKVASESVPLGELAPGDERMLDRTLAVDAPQEGIYIISAVAAVGDRLVEGDSLGLSILPTLLLKGAFDGTALSAAACRPFTIRYQVRNAGNIQPTNGSLKLELRSADQKELLYAQQLPFSLDAGAHRIDQLAVPRGTYRLTARASAVNQQMALTADFLLADQPLTVTSPVEVSRSSAPFPRVLIWTDSDNATAIERALAEKLLKEAFPADSGRIKTVTRPEDFASEAQTGHYSVYALFEVEPAPDTAEIVQGLLAKGGGAVIIGSRGRTQSLAEALGFQFGSPLPGAVTNITFPPDSGLGVTGSIPVTGRFLLPRKDGARAAATLPDGQPAVLVDARKAGRVIVLPFPLVQSSQAMGATDLYSLLLRSSVLAAAPEREVVGGIASEQLIVSALSGTTERARIVVTLPPGAKVLWTNVPHAQKGGTLSFELTAGDEARKVLYLYTRTGPGNMAVPTELFTECEGKYVSQGKVE